jgi:mannosyltransferase OCH1-like enzyme
MQADFFRLFALYACGGLYVDADIKNLGSHVYLTERDCYLFRRHGNVANDLMFFRRPRNVILRRVIGIVLENISARRPGTVWELSGPGVFNRVIKDLTSIDPCILDTVDFDGVERLRNHVQFCWALEYKNMETHWTNVDNYKNYIG